MSANSTYRVHGAAWGGEATVVKVEISCDAGQNWSRASLLDEVSENSWRFWEFEWRTPERPGKSNVDRARNGFRRAYPTGGTHRRLRHLHGQSMVADRSGSALKLSHAHISRCDRNVCARSFSRVRLASSFTNRARNAPALSVASYLLNARLLGGVVCYIAVMILFVAAFKKGGALTVLYPIYATTFVWAALIAWMVYAVPIRPINVGGMLLLVAGMYLMGR